MIGINSAVRAALQSANDVAHDTFSQPALVTPQVQGGEPDREWTPVSVRVHWSNRALTGVDQTVGNDARGGTVGLKLDTAFLVFRSAELPPSRGFKGMFVIVEPGMIFSADTKAQERDPRGYVRMPGRRLSQAEVDEKFSDAPVPEVWS